MTPLFNTAHLGMRAAQTALDVSAHNVANLATAGFQRQQAVPAEAQGGGVETRIQRSPQPGAALEADMVSQLQAKNAFLANLQVFKTASQMAGRWLDTQA